MKMNSPIGKKILSMVRNGDYAHPGEESAIDLVLKNISKNQSNTILDVGCGRGGTADYIYNHGWGKVTAFDIDAESIKYAQDNFPQVNFFTSGIDELNQKLTKEFDIITLFTVFYALKQQKNVLISLNKVIKPKGNLIIFDYTDLTDNDASLQFHEDKDQVWQPIKIKEIKELFADTGWKITKIQDISNKFDQWYMDLVDKIEQKKDQIINYAGNTWYTFVFNFYSNMLKSIKQRKLGGVIIQTRNIS